LRNNNNFDVESKWESVGQPFESNKLFPFDKEKYEIPVKKTNTAIGHTRVKSQLEVWHRDHKESSVVAKLNRRAIAVKSGFMPTYPAAKE